jgi:hypothetical protein
MKETEQEVIVCNKPKRRDIWQRYYKANHSSLGNGFVTPRYVGIKYEVDTKDSRKARGNGDRNEAS